MTCSIFLALLIDSFLLRFLFRKLRLVVASLAVMSTCVFDDRSELSFVILIASH